VGGGGGRWEEGGRWFGEVGWVGGGRRAGGGRRGKSELTGELTGELIGATESSQTWALDFENITVFIFKLKMCQERKIM